MGTFEKFTHYRDALPARERRRLDGALAILMEQHDVPPLSAEQSADIERRFADPSPEYATRAEVDAVFGRPFPH